MSTVMETTPHGSDLQEEADQSGVPPGGSNGTTFFPSARRAGNGPEPDANVSALRHLAHHDPNDTDKHHRAPPGIKERTPRAPPTAAPGTRRGLRRAARRRPPCPPSRPAPAAPPTSSTSPTLSAGASAASSWTPSSPTCVPAASSAPAYGKRAGSRNLGGLNTRTRPLTADQSGVVDGFVTAELPGPTGVRS